MDLAAGIQKCEEVLRRLAVGDNMNIRLVYAAERYYSLLPEEISEEHYQQMQECGIRFDQKYTPEITAENLLLELVDNCIEIIKINDRLINQKHNIN